MGEFFSGVLDSLPGDAYGMYFVLFLMTCALVRCSMHPTAFALIALPGTAAHELSHYIAGKLLGAKPASMSLLPKPLGDGRWELGSVGFTNLKWWNAPWTAMAPMLLAPLALALVLLWAYPAWAAGDFLIAAIALYVCATVLQASWPSDRDFEVAFPGLLIIGVVVYCLW